MGISDAIMDLGRAVAYYPNLKKVTNSTTATILLCQLLYWSARTRDKDGWVWKTSDELEEETGLTYNEQRTAKKLLADLDLITYEFKRLDHNTQYKVNQEELDRQWKYQMLPPSARMPEGFVLDEEEQKKKAEEEARKRKENADKWRQRTSENKDAVDGIIASMQSKGMEKEQKKTALQNKLEESLKINADSRRWEAFVEFAYQRSKVGEDISTFCKWAKVNGFDPIYWTPEKMKTLWPQAFVAEKEISTVQIQGNDVAPAPKTETKKYAEMPEKLKNIGK